MTTDEQLRSDGITANLAAATSGNRDYRHHAERVLAEFIRRRIPFTADEIRKAIPDGVEAHHPNVLPSLLGAAASKHVIRPVGFTNSTRPSRHASRNRVWIAA